ncbi:hypothetical protein TWF718_001163 [Orbilia javanica]|uniref:Uncharacterized protein n=1 Tax=Orbilia javanica TaxID=47235 RepID=A0AAN8N8E2_9PEZI
MSPHREFMLSMLGIVAICLLGFIGIIACYTIFLYSEHETKKAPCVPMIITSPPEFYPIAIPGSVATSLIPANTAILAFATTVTNAAVYTNATNFSRTPTGPIWFTSNPFTPYFKTPAECWGYRITSQVFNQVVLISTEISAKIVQGFRDLITWIRNLPVKIDIRLAPDTQEEAFVVTHLRGYGYRLYIHPVRAAVSFFQQIRWYTLAQVLSNFLPRRDARALVARA